MRTESAYSIPQVMPLKERNALITLNCGKGVNQGVTCTSMFLVLRSFTVENQLAVLSTTRSL